MYEEYYGFNTKPFSLLPDPDFLYRGKTHRLALTTLEYGILHQAGFVVLTGEPGMGKTTLLQQILAEHRDHFTIGLLTNTHSEMESLLPWILLAFGIKEKNMSKIEAFHAFSQFLNKEHIANRRVLLIVDEAQNLGVALLEELRLLSNINQNRTQVLQIILSGQPDLHVLLKRKDLTQFAQRVMADYHLEPFKEEDTAGYIHHRLAVAGRTQPLFTDLSSTLVHRLTGGIPRLINQLCDTALTYGYAEQTAIISATLLSQAAKERCRGGILPLVDHDYLFTITKEQEEAEQRQMTTFMPTCPAPPPMKQPMSAAIVTGQSLGQSRQSDECYERGTALRKVGLYKEAIRQFTLAAEDPALTFKAMAQVGLCYKATGQHNEAVNAFRAALRAEHLSSSDALQVRYLLARTLESLGRISETLEAYRWIRREDPGYRDVAERIDRLSSGRSRSIRPVAANDNPSWMNQAFSNLQRIWGKSNR